MGALQVISGILLVFGLLGLLYWLAHRLNGGKGFAGRDSRIQVLETRSIGDKRTLLLVKVGDDHFFLGATGTNISLLSAISDSAPVETQADAEETSGGPRSTFLRMLETLR